MAHVDLSDPAWHGRSRLAQPAEAHPVPPPHLPKETEPVQAAALRDWSSLCFLLAGGLLLTGGLFAYSRIRDSADSSSRNDSSQVTREDTGGEAPSSLPIQSTTPDTTTVSSRTPEKPQTPLPSSATTTRTPEKTRAERDNQQTVFRKTSHLIGQKIPSLQLRTTPSASAPRKPREIDLSSTHADSIVCLLPAMYDARLKRHPDTWRAGWQQFTGGTSCEVELKILQKHFNSIRANGLSLAIVSGQSVPSAPVKERGVNLVSDHNGSLARALGLPPFRYQGEEFHPRVTMLVRNGEIVGAFSATDNFEVSLKSLLALSQDLSSKLDQPRQAR